MKKFIGGLVLGLMIFAGPVSAEEIRDFGAVIKVSTDASVSVSEKISYDFGAIAKHGIYRYIPIKYQNGLVNYNLNISKIDVAYDNFTTSRGDGKLTIKIGDADKLIDGVHLYSINYLVKKAIGYFSDYDELYWNVTGNGWLVNIDNVKVELVLPKAIAKENLRVACYAGAIGSTKKCSDQVLESNGAGLVTGVSFSQSNLQAGEGLTIAVGWPKGIVKQPTAWDKFWMMIADNIIFALPVLVFIFMFWLWWTRGRDPKGQGTIIAEYDPPAGLSPSQVGALIDDDVSNSDLSAEIIQLAVLGYLKIEKLTEKVILWDKEDYKLIKLKEAGEDLKSAEKFLLSKLFFGQNEIKLSELNNKFYDEWAEAKIRIMNEITKLGFYQTSPDKVKSKYTGIGIGVMFVGVIIIWASKGINLPAITIGLSGLIVIAFGRIMPARTVSGVSVREKALGFKEYLNVAEKARLEFHNAPAKTPERFEKILPYAIALGVEKKWAKEFEGIYNTQPKWYSDPAMNNFSALMFVGALHNFNASAGSTLQSSPQSNNAFSGGSGGGGFSGGGFGGGGGGSW